MPLSNEFTESAKTSLTEGELRSMTKVFGIRREDKSVWERRCPLTPNNITGLLSQNGTRCLVQPSDIRIFSNEEFLSAGAELREDLSDASVIFGVKEVPVAKLLPGKTYIYFSHVIKGQDYNMAMLKRLMELKCSLIDYETIVDEKKQRLIFFGRHAGLAGMLDSIFALGQRYLSLNINTPFNTMKVAHDYKDLAEAKAAVSQIGEKIRNEGLPESLLPFVIGVTGYGNVSKGAQEIIDLLPVCEITPDELSSVRENPTAFKHKIIKVVFKEEHLARRKDGKLPFELSDYYNHPENYKANFPQYLPQLSMLINCIYWDERYPRLASKSDLKALFTSPTQAKLMVIGDISCDIGGSIEATVKATEPGTPNFVYEPLSEKIIDGVKGDGPVVMAVDILPSEISKDSSIDFGEALKGFVTHLLHADFSGSFADCKLIPELKRAMILYQGRLTPDYKYIEQYIK